MISSATCSMLVTGAVLLGPGTTLGMPSHHDVVSTETDVSVKDLAQAIATAHGVRTA
jgi:hypothetical protein